jgi:hypothetical protein
MHGMRLAQPTLPRQDARIPVDGSLDFSVRQSVRWIPLMRLDGWRLAVGLVAAWSLVVCTAYIR